MNKTWSLRKLQALVASAAVACAAHCGWAADFTIEISNFAFQNGSITIDVGDTVTWVNKDGMQHTTTSGVNGTPDGKWDSGLLSFDQSFPRTFNEAGAFPYFCMPHPFMTGTITVREATTTPLTVRITAPANQASFPAPTDVTIEATVSGGDGNVSKVAFFDGRAALGEDTSAPYSVTVRLEAGEHSLSAQATTSSGATAASDTVRVTVATSTPTGERIDDPIIARLPKGDTTIELEMVADGLIAPLGMAVPDDGSGRILVYDQGGLVHLISNGVKADAPVLDVRNRLVPLGSYDERGLLGLATHPNFAQSPLIYTYTSEPIGAAADFTASLEAGATNDHQSVIAEWRLDAANTNQVDVNSRREILRIDKPQANHNAGTMRFGPDGFLYITVGDGGAADDEGSGHVPGGNGQAITNVYGKVLRIDIDGRTAPNGQYAVPADNPFVGQDGLDEIYAFGLRNPYNFSFDRLTGELYLADVGQNEVEEINRVFRGGNYGWPIKEGSYYFDPNGTNAGFITTLPVREVPANLADPIAQYDHDEGVAVVGGYVYRGAQLPGLVGRYVAGDWGNFDQAAGRLFYLDHVELKELRIGLDDRPLGLWLRGFGQDQDGELYIFGSTNVGPVGTSGVVLKIVPPPAIEVAGVTATGTNIVISWTNGVSPFVVQTQDQIAEPDWIAATYAESATASFAVDGDAAFFRAASAAGNPATPFSVFLSGANERPNPVTTTATGTGTLNLEGNTLHFDIQYNGLSGAGTAAHIHGPAPASGAAGVLIDLAPFNGGGFGTNGSLSGSITLTAEQKAMILAGLTYVNVHTPNNPAGEIRGQIAPVTFVSHLSGRAERPNPVATTATGSALWYLTGNQLSFQVKYQNLSGAATAAHIHGPASSEESAGVLIDLAPYAIGGFGTNGTLAGTLTLSPEHLALIVDGRTYVNIHTPANPAGEIRGQLFADAIAMPLSSSLSGAAERPNPVTTPGSATGLWSLQGNQLHFEVVYSNLTAQATAAHIHGLARASQAAGVLVDLAPYALGGFGSNGVISGSVPLSDELRAAVMQGLTYINIHTPNNPGGEIRGQISPVLMQNVLLGTSERPQSVHTIGRGTGHFLLVGNQLSLNVTYRGLSSAATAAHIHGPASPADAAGVLIDLMPFRVGELDTFGRFAGTTAVTAEQLPALIDAMTYVNVHSAPNPAGEIRGQIVR